MNISCLRNLQAKFDRLFYKLERIPAFLNQCLVDLNIYGNLERPILSHEPDWDNKVAPKRVSRKKGHLLVSADPRVVNVCGGQGATEHVSKWPWTLSLFFHPETHNDLSVGS
jgi:hypothetical protein